MQDSAEKSFSLLSFSLNSMISFKKTIIAENQKQGKTTFLIHKQILKIILLF